MILEYRSEVIFTQLANNNNNQTKTRQPLELGINQLLKTFIYCKMQTTIQNFFESLNANEINDVLSNMLENYIVNAPVEKKDLANAASIFNSVNRFFYNLEALAKTKPDAPSVHVRESLQCLHN